MTTQIDRVYQGQIQRLQERINKLDKQLMSLLDVTNALQSLHDSFGKLSPMMQRILLRSIFFKDAEEVLQEG
eukprot:516472-Rhodomonas_salina.1